ncbi:MAG: archaeosortase/exosortase family protein [Chthoniobacterales bacterium]
MSEGNQVSASPRAGARRLTIAFAATAALIVAFLKPLYALVLYAAGSDVHSHILLVPIISAYLIYLLAGQLPRPGRPVVLGALGCGLCALLAFACTMESLGIFSGLSLNDHLTFTTLSFVGSLAAMGFLVLGGKWMAAAAFPMSFLFFMVPLPDAVVTALETASKYASAEAASWFFDLAGVPYVRDSLLFGLPGITIEVAQECSGIRSSLVLIITSLLAAYLFLRSPWRRFLLVAFVIPLGVLRNGFRIATIGWLCVHRGPHMIHSPIHKQGGPIFFALSLIPLFLFLWWLRRNEQTRPRRAVAEISEPISQQP